MPTGPTKHSAPRFVLPSSSKSDVQTPAPRKRFAQALNPGPSQPSSSQYAGTPRFVAPASIKKHVQWPDAHGIQDAGSSPPLPLSRSLLSSSVRADHDDTIDADFEETVSNIDDEEDCASILRIRDDSEGEHESAIGSTTSQSNPFHEGRNARKRRRLGTPDKKAIWLSSSSSPSPPHEDSEAENVTLDDRPSSTPDLPSPTLATRSLPRFRRADTTVNYEDEFSTTARPSFRLPPDEDLADRSNNVLPEAFSPARRRGKGKDYVPGGMADTMRSWIVGLTAEDQKHSLRAPGGDASRYTSTMRVVTVERDQDHRCALVRCDDGKMVMLIGNGGSFHDQAVVEGSIIGITAGRMSWSFESTAFSGLDVNEEMIVSVLWDVLEP